MGIFPRRRLADTLAISSVMVELPSGIPFATVAT
jgi:hypothetical protein